MTITLLGPLEGEGRDDDLASAGVGSRQDVGEFVVDAVDGGMSPVPVRPLAEEDVGAARDLGVAQDGHAPTPEVAREDDPLFEADDVHVEDDDRAAEDVAGVEERELDSRGDGHPATVRDRHRAL